MTVESGRPMPVAAQVACRGPKTAQVRAVRWGPAAGVARAVRWEPGP